MKLEHTEVMNMDNAIRGMRNPYNSWSKSDSGFVSTESGAECYEVGHDDLELAQKLIRNGPEHRKFMRQIFVSVDITGPLYWWKEFDTYKVGTVANSTSTMHKLASTPITVDCFEMDDMQDVDIHTGLIQYSMSSIWDDVITHCEYLRQEYNKTHDARYWKELIRLLPESWLQTRTVTMNYETLYSIYRQRYGHRLSEWQTVREWIEHLPYAQELIVIGFHK